MSALDVAGPPNTSIPANVRPWRGQRSPAGSGSCSRKRKESIRLMLIVRVLAAATLVGLPAYAQSTVEFSNIEAGDVLDTAPPSFEIRFTRDVTLQQLQLRTDSDEVMDLLDSGAPPRQAVFAIPLPELRDGDYVLSWRISETDGDVAGEDIDFIVVGFHDHSEHDHSDHEH
jgi:methionine-rich copper-binding protein CopC